MEQKDQSTVGGRSKELLYGIYDANGAATFIVNINFKRIKKYIALYINKHRHILTHKNKQNLIERGLKEFFRQSENGLLRNVINHTIYGANGNYQKLVMRLINVI